MEKRCLFRRVLFLENSEILGNSQTVENKGKSDHLPGEIIYTPPPPFRPGDLFQGEGGGGYIWKPPRGRILYAPPSFIRPPPLDGYFQGLGGGVYKIWPRTSSRVLERESRHSRDSSSKKTPFVMTPFRADFWEGDATKHFSVKKRDFQ